MKNLKFILFTIALIIGFLACEKGEVISPVLQAPAQQDYYLSMGDALNVGQTHFEISKEKFLKSKGVSPDFKNKKIKTKKTFKKEGENLFHVINYEGGGFVIISADKRVTPVLAYSETNNFEGEELPGISDWITRVSEGILKARKELKVPREQDSKLWSIYTGESEISTKMILPPDDEECNCNAYYESFSTGQYVDAVAQWSQGGQYSWYCPSDGGCNCDRKPAGCGAIEMAMIMNYYQHPQMNMSWNGEALTNNYPMPRGIYPYNCNYTTDADDRQISMLLRLCGSFDGSVYGILGNCATAILPGNIDNAHSNLFFSNGESWEV